MSTSPDEKPNQSNKKRYSLKRNSKSRKTLIHYEQELNQAQFEAVRTMRGPQLIIAGAGSGKTRTLVYRVAYLIEHGVDPSQILLLTFTKKSAQEMMRRAAAMLDGRCRQITGGTFHGFANSILRRYAETLGYRNSFTIADRSDAEDIINLVRAELGYAGKDKRFPRKRTILNIISKSINTAHPQEQIINDEYPQFINEEKPLENIAEAFQKYKRENSIMDYDDLLVNLRTLLIEHDSIRRSLSNEHLFVMVDEFQDTNYLQADIAHLLASEHSNIVAVGDDAQSIYSFRGANFQNIMEFPKKYDSCKIVALEQNYRSTEPILAFCNEIMAAAIEKYEKQLYSGILSAQKPVYLETVSFDEQANLFLRGFLN